MWNISWKVVDIFLSIPAHMQMDKSTHRDKYLTFLTVLKQNNKQYRNLYSTNIILQWESYSTHYWTNISTLWVKKEHDTLFLGITLTNVDGYSQFFHC